MSPTSRSSRRLIGSVLLAACLLTACASIPSTGPVLSGRLVNGDTSQGVFQVLPDGPRAGATAEGVVAGFLRAAAGFGQHHEVARDYLTPRLRLAWKPDTTVDVYPTESSVELKEAGQPSTSLASASLLTTMSSGPAGEEGNDHGETTQVTVQTPVEAQIDSDSRYHLAPPGQTVTRTFSLVRSTGQWRISAAADGILVSDLDFDATFRPFPVYFADPSVRYLVPDLHWFADTRDEPGSPELPTALVRVLLEGPPSWLRGAVVTGAPPGTAMAVDAVVVSSGNVATVDLTDEVRAATTRQRQLLISQLQATLGQLNTIDSVQITVRRLDFDVPPGSPITSDPSQADLQPVADPGVDGGPVAIDSKGRLVRLVGRTLVPVKDVAGLAVPGANRPAVSSDSSAYAVLNADRSQLLLQLPGTTARPLVKSAGLSAPSFDPDGWLWTAPAANAGFVFAATTDAGPVKVRAPWLTAHEVVSLRISRDSSRAVVAARYRGQAHLYLTGVIRDAQGRPLSLTPPSSGLMPDLASIQDVAWVDEDQVVVLGRRSSSPGVRPWIVQLGGKIQSTSDVPGAESITAGNGDPSLMAGTARGIQARSGALWERISSGQWPAFPG